MITELVILVEGVILGRVFEQTKRGGTLSFQYDPGWLGLKDAFPLSVSMPLSEAPYRQRFIKTFLVNLLPENPAILEAWEKKYHVSRNNPFGLLRHVGEDVPGALQFVQPDRIAEYQDPGPARIQWLTADELSERMALLQKDAAAFRLANDQGRMSLAGAQAKTALYFDGKRWGVPAGRMPTSHILKPRIPGFDGIVENEHLCQDIAARCGLAAARSFVLNLDEPVIVVERFDRLPHPDPARILRRVHQEDMCQALQKLPGEKYQESRGPGVETIVRLIRGVSTAGAEDVWRFIDANILNYLIGGTDAHAKNYSLLLGANRQVRLSPLYDVSTQLPYKNKIPQRLAMKIGRFYEIASITAADWESLARHCKLDETQMIERVHALAQMLPDQIAAARDQALREKLDAPSIREASELMLKHVAVRLKGLGRAV
jgi:serine/threonine-protein kinase HipA